MKKDKEKFTRKNAVQLAVSLLILLLIFVIPKRDFYFLKDFLNFLKNLFYFSVHDYPYLNPPVFFSIGEALATIAIVLAVYQFKKESWEIALEIRRGVTRAIVVLIFCGFIATIFSSITLFWKPSNILQLSVLWQILGSFLIIFAIMLLFLKTTNRKLFNEQTKDRFISALLRRVASRSPRQINLVVDVLITNLKTIFKEVISTPRGGEISEFTKNAHFILTQIVSDPIFANHVITSRADFFQIFLRNISEFNLYGDHSVSTALDSLVRASFSNKDSYFYNELKHSGPGIYYRPFLNDIFFDQNVFLNLRPFEQINFSIGEEIDSEKLDLFLDALEIALEGYWQEPRSIDFEYSHYRKAFESIENALSRVVDEVRNNESKNDWHITSKLHQITFFAGWKFQYLYRETVKNNKVSQHDLNVPIDEKSYGIYPKSLTAGYAELLFKLLCILSDYPQKDAIRHYAMFMTDHILIFNEVEFANIRAVLLKYIWEQIKENVQQGFYPAVLPVFLSLIGMWQDGATPERKALYNQTVNFLDNELKPKIIAGAKMANDDLMEESLLPPEVIFNKEKGLFEWKIHRGTQEMIIRP